MLKTSQRRLEINRCWRQRNKEKVREKNKRWKINNLEKYKQSQKKYEERRKLKRKNIRLLKEIFKEFNPLKQNNQIYQSIKKQPITKKEYNVKYYQKNKKKEFYKSLKKKWFSNNKEKRNLYERRRKAKKRGAIELFTNEQWLKKLEKSNGICPTCKKFVGMGRLTIDHTPPISKIQEGFIYTIKNISPLCASCNSKKNNKDF